MFLEVINELLIHITDIQMEKITRDFPLGTEEKFLKYKNI